MVWLRTPEKLESADRENRLMAIPPDLLRDIDHMDPLPITIQRLMEMQGQEIVSPRDLAEVVEYDQAIAATLLRVANSSIVGSRVHIGRVGDAVMRLGVDQILAIALGSHYKKISRPAEMYDLSENELWLHGALASVAAKEIAAVCKSSRIPPIVGVAALTHDIGKLIMVRYVKADTKEIARVARERELTFVEAEKEIFGFDHAEVGGAVAEKWSFPDEVRDAIARHHQAPVEDSTPVLDTVILANWVAKTIGVGLGAEGMNFNVDAGVAKRLGFRHPEFIQICSRTADLMGDLKRLYGVEEAA
jgi:putative nucleotidyltransferase with HDIG domain